MKTKYQISWNGCYSDKLWDEGWRVRIVFKKFPFPIIFKWTKD